MGEAALAEWVNKGERFNDGRGEVRVMTVVEGYAMVRRKGCMPFVIYQKDLLRLPWERSTVNPEGNAK